MGDRLRHLLNFGLLLTAGTVLLAGCTVPPHPPPPPDLPALARHYAPLIRQGTATSQDYITAADFDGDWVSRNNWEHQPDGDLSAYVYYSVIETESHWFLFYALFHPRDYTRKPCETSGGCHENDMESLQLVIARDGTPFGHLLAMTTLAHGDLYLYIADSSVKGNFLPLSGIVRFEGSHPVVYVETYGHGIHGQSIALFPRVTVYRVGDHAERPDHLGDQDVRYRLLPIETTLWAHRHEIGPGRAFDCPFDYRGHILPACFDGDNYGEDKANTPWGYNQATGDALSRGDWFLDPVKAWRYHATFAEPLSTVYTVHPYREMLTPLRR